MSLELQDVELRLHGRVLVPRFSARVEPGELLALMGESGSGKSSLQAWIAGLLEPPFEADGRVVIDGADLTDEPTERRRIGLLFQDDLLFPHLTVMENLLFAVPADGSRAERRERAEAVLTRAGLSGYGSRAPGSLSGGQRARVSLLRALLAKPRALLLDEPYGRLDAALRQRMREFVRDELREHQVAAVLVTHDAHDVPPGTPCIVLPPLPAGAAAAPDA